MLLDLLTAIKALGHLVSLGVLNDPTRTGEPSSLSVASARNTVDTQISAVCGDIFTEANNDTDIFWASDVYDCLRNVPFSIGPALRFLEYFNTTLQFQSTLAFLKSPPHSYQQPAVDVESIVGRIKTNVQAGKYLNQYDFEADVQRLVFAMHDGHVSLHSGIMSAFSFGTRWELASVSVDGKQPPRIYLTGDILQAQLESWSWKPSAITTINDEDVISYLTRFASNNSFGKLEAHAEWNDLMSHPALDVIQRHSTWSGEAKFYPGDNLSFVFEDGSDVQTSWWSYYNYRDSTGPIATGGDVYNLFVLGLYPATNERNATRIPDSTVARRHSKATFSDHKARSMKRDDNNDDMAWKTGYGAYPQNPDINQSEALVGKVAGYYLRDISTGVLSINSFNLYGDDLKSFTQTVQNFIDSAKNEKIDHVIIDLQQNLGGKLGLAFDTFSRFFPDKTPFAGSRRRSHAMSRILGNVTTSWWSTLNPASNDSKIVDEWWDGLVDEWVITPRLKAQETRKHFHDWEEYAGPKEYLGDAFTLSEEYDFSNESFNYQALDMSPYGYTDNINNATQPWDAKDIVLLTDGLCSSTCAMLVEFMTRMGVRTVTMGGRPSSGPMQAASGTRGALAYSARLLDNDLAWAGLLDATANRTFPNIPPNNQYRDSGIWTTSFGINLRDQIREDELGRDDAVPLQFKYEAADCRLYYTLYNLYSMPRQWRDVAAAAWNDSSLCVDGSTGFSTTGRNMPKNKAPVTPFKPDEHGILAGGFTPPSGSEIMSSLVFNSGPFFDGPFPFKELHRCIWDKDELEYGCPESDKNVCLPFVLECKPNGKKIDRPRRKVYVCVPTCNAQSTCSFYNDEYKMSCTPWKPAEQKLSAKLMGYEDTKREKKLKWQGICRPQVGSESICSAGDE